MTKDFDARNEEKSRSVCAAMAEADDTGKRVLSEKERRILDMWPRFEDGEPVWLGDRYEDNEGHECFASGVHLDIDGPSLVDSEGFHDLYRKGKCVKRPAPKVLDADGVPIKVGDTVWHHSGFAHGVVTSIDAGSLMGTVRYVNGGVEFRDAAKDLTHTCPDSWERLEEDAVKVVCEYAGAVPDEFGDYDCDTCRLFDARGKLICEQQMALDIVRRAKAIAGVEVDG